MCGGAAAAGFAEHSGRKREALQALADVAGAAVAAVDLHGHGLSEPKDEGLRGIVRSYLHLVRGAGRWMNHAQHHAWRHSIAGGVAALVDGLSTHPVASRVV